MKKKLVTMAMALCMVFAAPLIVHGAEVGSQGETELEEEEFVRAAASQITVDGIVYELEDDGTASVEGVADEDSFGGNVVIPGTVNSGGKAYAVTSIGPYAFFQCRSLAEITLPSSITVIGENAFYVHLKVAQV